MFETPGVPPVKMSMKIQEAKVEKAKLDRESGHGEIFENTGRGDL